MGGPLRNAIPFMLLLGCAAPQAGRAPAAGPSDSALSEGDGAFDGPDEETAQLLKDRAAGPLLFLQVLGQPREPPPLPAELATGRAGTLLRGSYEVCLDAQAGTTREVRPLQGLAGLDEGVAAALREARWTVTAPDSLDRRALEPLCFRQELSLPVPAPSEVVVTNTPVQRRKRIGGEVPHLPELVRARLSGPKAEASYQICVDPKTGHLRSITPQGTIAGADRALRDALSTWSYRIELPRETAQPVCFPERLVFQLEAQAPRLVQPVDRVLRRGAVRVAVLPPPQPPFRSSVPTDAPAPAPEDGAPPRPRPSILVKKEKRSGAVPHLPRWLRPAPRGTSLLATYRLCIDTTGRVSEVTPLRSVPGVDATVMAALETWTFAPPPIPLCFVDMFQWIVD